MSKTKDKLIAELSHSRLMLGRDCDGLRQELDVQAKINRMVRRRPFAWLGGAAALGWILAGPKTKTRVLKKTFTASGKKIRSEKPKSAPRLGWLGAVLALTKLSLPLLKPVLTAYAGKRFAAYAEKMVK